jgi:hypothetical protein
MASNTVIPYDTGKVKIGLYYTPPKRIVDLGVDAEMLQSALLSARVSRLRTFLYRWFGV